MHPFRSILPMGLMFAGSACAAALAIPSTHPRLWYGDSARLQQARQFHTTRPLVPQGSDRLVELAMRSVITGNAADCTEPVAAMFAFEAPPATRPGGFRDAIRQGGEHWLLMYDWCHAHFTADQRRTLVARWNGYMDRELADNLGNAGQEANNYWSGRTANLLSWGIASHGESPRAQEFIDLALDVRMGPAQFGRWYADFGRGGVFPEGSDYGVVSLSYPLVPFASAADFGHDAFARTPYFREAVYALIYGSTPGPSTIGVPPPGAPFQPRISFFPFNDDENFFAYGAINARDYLGDFASWLGTRSNDAAARHARAWLAMSQAGRRWMFDALGARGSAGDLAALPLDFYAAGAGVMAMRTSHGSDAMQVQLQLGTPGGISHRHWDAGNFQVWRKGRWVTRESVGYSDRLVAFGQPSGSPITMDSSDAAAHNTLLFEGANTAIWIGSGPHPVPPGGNPQHDQPRGLPRIVRMQSDPDFAFAAVDYSAAYRNGRDSRADWPYADVAWREFIFVRPLQALIVLDRMRGSSDSQRPFYRSDAWLWDGPHIDAAQVRRSFVMHFETPPVAQGGRVSAVTGSQTSELITLIPSSPAYRIANEDVAGDELSGQHRVELDSIGQAESYFLNVITARDAGEAAIDVQLRQTGADWVIELSHPQRGAARVVLKPGMTSEGGRVELGGRSTALCDALQPFEIGVAGPAWEPTCTGSDVFSDGFEPRS